jgi:hypothetical protein
VVQNKAAINGASKEIDALLTEIVSSLIRVNVFHAFARSLTY